MTINGHNENAKRLEDLYREVGPCLLAYFRRRHANPHTAEDLLQETFAAVMKNPDHLLLSPAPRAYLFGAARNLSINAYRRYRPVEELEPDHPAAEPIPGDARVELMRDAINRLNSSLREVLELRLQQELSYGEISVVLELPIGTVRSRLHHAVRHLRQKLNPGGHAGEKGYHEP